MKLTPTMEKYILHWGEMGARWGMNRTISQIYALLYLSPKPLAADEIVELLSVARSNVSTSIRELQSYGIIKVVHLMGERRDYFEATHDIWEFFLKILEERKRRELDPTLTMLRQCVIEAETDKDMAKVTKERIQNMLDFTETMTDWYSQIRTVPKPALIKLMKLGSKVAKFVSKKS